jgi:hypothetical protein
MRGFVEATRRRDGFTGGDSCSVARGGENAGKAEGPQRSQSISIGGFCAIHMSAEAPGTWRHA